MSTKSLVLDPTFAELKRYVIATTGLVYFQDKDEDLSLRVTKRLEARALTTCREYLNLLSHGPDARAEFDRLTVELTIGETYFFRHEEQFDDLRTTIVPDLIRRNQVSRRLHVWCAGCSIGAEPYSIAILLEEHFGAVLSDWDVRIIATDINRDFLERAERGVFDEWAFRTTKPEFRTRHFVGVGKSWEIKPIYRRRLEFRYHNLITHPWTCPALTGQFELITCRNVMIYFDAPTNAKVTAFFENALVPDGWLVIGHAEMVHGLGQLELRQLPRVTAYRKTATAAAPPYEPPVLTTLPVAETPIPQSAPAPVPAPATPSPARAEDTTAYLKILANAGEFELAAATANELLSRDAGNAVAYYYRALVLMQLGREAKAEADLLRAIAITPDFVMAHYQAALLTERRGERHQSARHRRRTLELLKALAPDASLPEGDELRAADLLTLITNRREVA